MAEPRDTAERLIKALNDGDETALTDLLAEDVTLDAPGGVRRRGVGATARYLMSWVNGFPGCRVTFIRLLVEGNDVVQVLRFEGTHTATLEGQGEDFPATGRLLDLQMVWIGRYDHRLLVALQLNFDRLDLMTQLGLTTRRPVATV